MKLRNLSGWHLILMTMFVLVAIPLLVLAQNGKTQTSAAQISALMTELSQHTKSPAELLDPDLNPSQRQKSLGYFSTSHYKLTLIPASGIPPVTGDTASIPVRVHYSTGQGNYLDGDATANFVKRNGTWYFSDYDFLSVPSFLIVVIILCVLVGIAYATFVVILLRRLQRQQKIGPGIAAIFIPFFWPYLFRQTRKNRAQQ